MQYFKQIQWRRYIPYLLVLAIILGMGSWLKEKLPIPQKKPETKILDHTYNHNLKSGLSTKNLDTEITKTPVVEIAQKVMPSVVGIIGIDGEDFLSRSGEEQTGSGVIFDADNGYIVTNNHVIKEVSRIIVTLADGREIPAKLIGRDTYTDLAVLQIQAPDLTAATFGDSDELSVGETAIAIGNPLGMRFARSVTVGVISGLNRFLVTEEGNAYHLIQTDAAINPGNSGGPLVNAHGQVVGINSVKIALPGFEGMGFSIPINQAKTVIETLTQNKPVNRPALGIRLIGEITPDAAQYYHLPVDYGVVVEVHPLSPAEKAGMRDKDIIIAVNNQPIHTAAELQKIIFEHQVGETVQVKILRNNEDTKSGYKDLALQVTLGQLKKTK